MAKQNEDEGPDDQTLFDEAVNEEQDEAPVTETPAEPEKVEGEPDPAKAESEQDKPDPELADDKIPTWRRAEMAEATRQARKDADEARQLAVQERAARTALEQRLQALERPASATDTEPDPLIDPKAYRDHIRKELREEILADRRETSLQMAHKAYGKEFEEAYTVAQQRVDAALKARMQQSRDPGETLIQWYREQKTMREVGNDPNAWLEKKLEERLKDPAFLAKAVELARGSASTQQPSGRPAVRLPPSLNGASRANAAVSSTVEDVDDEQLFNDITAA